MTGSNLTAYTAILENSAATPGLFDSRFNQAFANIQAVDTNLSTVSTSVSQLSVLVSSVSGSGISGYINVQSAAYGALGNGTTDDRGAFLSANTSTATQNVLYVPSAASVYRIASAVTINGTYSPIRGAVLRPVSGTTVYHKGAIDAGPYQLWDNSLGGKVDFTNNREIQYFLPQWFGVVGDLSTNDIPALNFMVDSIPDYSTVLFSGGLQMLLNTTWQVTNRAGLRFISERIPFPNGAAPVPGFYWNGPSALSFSDASMTSGSALLSAPSAPFTSAISGEQVIIYGGHSSNAGLRGKVISFQSTTQVTLDTAASATTSGAGARVGGIMIFLDRCLFPEISGFVIKTDDGYSIRKPAMVGIEIDGYGGGAYGYGTEATISNNLFYNSSRNSYLCHLRMSEVAISNQEYHHIRNNRFTAGGNLRNLQNHFSTDTASATSRRVTNTGNIFSSSDVAAATRLRIPSAGGTNTPLDVTIVGFISSSQVTISAPASVKLTDVPGFYSDSVGVGLRNGGSFNAKRQEVFGNSFVGYNAALQFANGSLVAGLNTFTFNEIDRQIAELSEPAIFTGDNSEAGGQAIVQFSHPSVSFYGCRFAPAWTKPNGSYFELQNQICVVDACEFDQAPLAGSSYYTIGTTKSEFVLRGNHYPYVTRAEMGMDETTLSGLLGSYTQSADVGFSDPIGGTINRNYEWRHHKFFRVDNYTYDDNADNAAIHAHIKNHYPTTEGAAVIGTVWQTDPTWGSSGTLASFHAKLLTGGQHFDAQTAVGFRATLPRYSSNDVMKSMTGVLVESSSRTGGAGSITTCVGLQIDSLNTTGATVTYAVIQSGVSDPNVWNAPSYGTSGQGIFPAYAFSSESSLGFYRSGVSTLAPSYGTLNLATNSVRLSMRTAGSIDSTNLAVNEVAFSILGASGATLAIRSGGTIWYFNSSASTKG